MHGTHHLPRRPRPGEERTNPATKPDPTGPVADVLRGVEALPKSGASFNRTRQIPVTVAYEFYHKLMEFPTVQARIDYIAECYARGEKILVGKAHDEVCDALRVDFNFGERDDYDWLIENVLDHEIDLETLNKMPSWEVALLVQYSDLEPDEIRVAQLHARESEIRRGVLKTTRTVVDLLGLTEEEIEYAIDLATQEVFDSDSGWHTEGILEFEANNAWWIVFQITDTGRSTDYTIRVEPPQTLEALVSPEDSVNTGKNYQTNYDKAETGQALRAREHVQQAAPDAEKTGPASVA